LDDILKGSIISFIDISDRLWYLAKTVEVKDEDNIVIERLRPNGEQGFTTGYSLKDKDTETIKFADILKNVQSLAPTTRGQRLYKISVDEYEEIDRLYYISKAMIE
jgi:hypothetical protein